MSLEGVYAELVQKQSLTANGEEEKDLSTDVKETTSASMSGMFDGIHRVNSGMEDGKEDHSITEQAKKKKANTAYSRVYQMSKPDIIYSLGGSFFSAVNGIIFPMYGFIFSEALGALDTYSNDRDTMNEEVRKWCLSFTAIGVVSLFSQTFDHVLFSVSGERLTKRLRSMSFLSMLRQEIGWFDLDENSTGALTAKLATEATYVNGLWSGRLSTTIMGIVSSIAAVAIAFSAGWKMSLVLLAALPAIILAGLFQMKALLGTSEGKTAYEESGRIACEAVENIRTVQSLSLETRLSEIYQRRLNIPYQIARRQAFVGAIGFGLSQSTIFLVYALAFWYGAVLVRDDGYSFTNVFKVFGTIVFSMMILGQIGQFAPDIAKAQVAAESIFAIIDRKPRIDAFATSGDNLEKIKGSISFSNVQFSYPTRSEVKVLDCFNLDVQPGETVAIVGSSGSGKSTVVSLLERFYDAQVGSVKIDGKDIKNLNVRDLRKHLAIVSQEPVLFDTTIAENIAYGKPDATVDEIETAANSANIHNFVVTQPKSYKTRVGEKGAQLSGGQKQRVAIARAIVRDPRVLLLDEATSALDAESESIVQEALDRASQGRTTIVVAHRLSTIQDADRIVVLNNGKIEEMGRHDELIARKGHYFELVNHQLQQSQQ